MKWNLCPVAEGGFEHGEEGSSVLELALLMPMLVLILIGSIDFGQAYYAGIEVAAAAEAGTSYGLANPQDTAGMRSAALLDAGDLPTMTAAATYGCECSNGTSGTLNCATTPSCSINLVNYVDVTTSVSYRPMLLYALFSSTFSFQGHSRMRLAP